MVLQVVSTPPRTHTDTHTISGMSASPGSGLALLSLQAQHQKHRGDIRQTSGATVCSFMQGAGGALLEPYKMTSKIPIGVPKIGWFATGLLVSQMRANSRRAHVTNIRESEEVKKVLLSATCSSVMALALGQRWCEKAYPWDLHMSPEVPWLLLGTKMRPSDETFHVAGVHQQFLDDKGRMLLTGLPSPDMKPINYPQIGWLFGFLLIMFILCS